MNKLVFLALGTAALVSTPVFAADLYVAPTMAPMASAPAPSSWDGLYIGAFAGYSWGTADVNATVPVAGTGSFNVNGAAFGIQGGYNFHLSDTIVAGISADIARDNSSGSGPLLGSTASGALNWTGSVTGRVGVDYNGIVPYVLGGIAFANGTGSDDYSNGSDTQNLTGYTVGAGLEFALADHLSADVEYRYTNYGSATFNDVGTGPTVGYSASYSNSAIRAGLNYHFN